ncbi:hypothetical protein KSS87_010729 [Heliosperma pusillum]|nr:hypothetical protein KSS87_010729 [Heliosperma pusillum]
MTEINSGRRFLTCKFYHPETKCVVTTISSDCFIIRKRNARV